jgi:hypothetical protein
MLLEFVALAFRALALVAAVARFLSIPGRTLNCRILV